MFTLVTREKSVVQSDSAKHHKFSPGTPVSSCSNTGPMTGGPYSTSRENSLVIIAEIIYCQEMLLCTF